MSETLQQSIELIENSIAQLIASFPALVIAVIVFYLFYRASKPISLVVRKSLATARRKPNLQLVMGRLTRWIVVLAGFLIASMIALPGFSPSELIGLLGIGSVAVGFAFRDILQNFLAGILILLTEPFNVGDQIVYKEYEGTVEDIQIRATKIRTYDNRQVVIPNGELFTNAVTVNTAYNMRRSEYAIGIGYQDDVGAAQRLCLDILSKIDGVLDNPAPDTIMVEMGDSSVVFLLRWWTNSRYADVLQVQDAVLRMVKNRLIESGFTIPFPIRTVYFHNVSETGVSVSGDGSPT